MCVRKAAGVVSLLQRLTKVQIGTRFGTVVPEWASSHSQFAAKMDFPACLLGGPCFLRQSLNGLSIVFITADLGRIEVD